MNQTNAMCPILSVEWNVIVFFLGLLNDINNDEVFTGEGVHVCVGEQEPEDIIGV